MVCDHHSAHEGNGDWHGFAGAVGGLTGPIGSASSAMSVATRCLALGAGDSNAPKLKMQYHANTGGILEVCSCMSMLGARALVFCEPVA